MWVPGQEDSSALRASDPDVADQLFKMANRSRVELGVKPLAWDTALVEAASKHCTRMSSEIPLLHKYEGEPDLTTRVASAGEHFSMVEENLAIGKSAAVIHGGWLNSPGHRKNLMNPEMDHVGIAVIEFQGLFFAVADYTREAPVLKPGEVEEIFASLLRSRHILISQEKSDARLYCSSSGKYRGGFPARLAMRWQNSDLTQLPPDLIDALANGSYRNASVGSCPAQSVNGTFTTYRVAVLLY